MHEWVNMRVASCVIYTGVPVPRLCPQRSNLLPVTDTHLALLQVEFPHGATCASKRVALAQHAVGDVRVGQEVKLDCGKDIYGSKKCKTTQSSVRAAEWQYEYAQPN
jgi:hypothetical protein